MSNNQIDELMNNQNHILEAIQNLNERLVVVEEKLNDDHADEVKNIVETQAMIDKIIVKNSDDIVLMKKAYIEVREEGNTKDLKSEIAIELMKIDAKIEELGDKEKVIIESVKTCYFYKIKLDRVHKTKRSPNPVAKEIILKFLKTC